MSDPTPSFPVLASPQEGEPLYPVWVIQPPRHRWWLHLLLLAATFVTTMLVGAHMHFNFVHHLPVFALDDDLDAFLGVIAQQPSKLLLGLPFSLTLMFILLAHEMGHYLCARRYHIYATLPFFIPFPSLIGTLGAFIRIKSPIPSRKALFDVGIAGPIAGFIPACAAVFVGLSLSRPLAPAQAAAGAEFGILPLIFHIAARALRLHASVGSLSLHPIAAAGWVGMFATALNLLPGGQLDGGHILYAVSPRLHRWISLATVVALVPLAEFFWVGWLVWAVVLWMTSYHPPVPRQPGLTSQRKIVAAFGVLMLTLAFSPEPFTGGAGRVVGPQIRRFAADTFHGLRDRLHHK